MTCAGKTVLVTGGGRGIGSGISQRLAAAGAFVVVNYVSRPEAAEVTLEQVRQAGGSGMTVQFDVSSASAIEQGIKEVLQQQPGIDILVNNAGITHDGLLATMKEDAWDAVLDTNLKSAFLVTKAVCRQMMKRRWGRIINIGSVVGATGNAGQANYSAAKAGLIGLTRSLARELASRNITVNAVAPGYIETDMTAALTDTVREKLLGEIPLRSLGAVADIAAAVAYLASDEARYVTGQVLHVNGGMYMG